MRLALCVKNARMFPNLLNFGSKCLCSVLNRGTKSIYLFNRKSVIFNFFFHFQAVQIFSCRENISEKNCATIPDTKDRFHKVLFLCMVLRHSKCSERK